MGIFGNNSDDIFRTQADTRFNSFSDPMNGVNQNRGNWGIDPSYLTPAYLSPYRPHYQAPSGGSSDRYRPSFGTSVNQVFNPFAGGGSNYGGNYMQQQSPFYDSMMNRPMDGAASFTQNWIAPGIASWAAYKYWGAASTQAGRAVGGGLMGGILGASEIQGPKLGMRAQAINMGIRTGRFTGGALAGIALPAIASQLAVNAVDSAVFDPYIAQRQMSGGLRENFEGVSFGESTGDRFNGGGINRGFAASIAKRVSQAGAMDKTFTQNETAMLTDYASRAGMLDNASSTQMAGRFESILKQVKLVMSIANTSDFKETIEIMAKMQSSGVGGSQLAGVMGRLGSTASSGGLSFNKLFNTLGAQGQYLFGAQGLTPYVGQIAGFESAAGIASGYRGGSISSAMLARMGGLEGAAQSATAGQIASYRSPYASMQAYNAYMGKGETGNVVSNVASFGNSMASNPLQTIGRFKMSQNALTSRHIEDRGLLGEQDRIYQLAQQLAGGVQANGKVDAGVAFSIMTDMMGMTPEMAHAKLAQIGAFGDNKAVGQMLAGNTRASKDALLKYQQQEGLDKGIFSSSYNAVKSGVMSIQRASAGRVGEVLEDVGDLTDSVQNYMTEALMGVKKGQNQFVNIDGSTGRGGKYNQVNTLNEKVMDANKNHKNYRDLSKLNKLAANGDEDARTALDPNSSKRDRKNAIDKLAKAGHVSTTTNGEIEELVNRITQLGTVQTGTEEVKGSVRDTLVASLANVGGGKNIDQNLEYINLMSDALGKGGDVTGEARKRIAELSGKSEDDLSTSTIREMAGDTITKVGKGRMAHLLGLKNVGNAEGLEKALKEQRGGIGLSPEIETSGDTMALNEQIKTQAGMAKARSSIQQMVKEGKIDMGTAMASINSLDNKQSTGKFADAVKDFVDGVTEFKGGKKPANDSPSAYEYFAEGKRRKDDDAGRRRGQ